MNKILTFLFFFLPIFCFGQRSLNPHFNRIVFQTFECMTGCPEYLLEVRSNRKIRLNIKKLYHRTEKELVIDSSKTGYFVGKVKKRLFKKLIVSLSDYKCEPEQNDKHLFYIDGDPAIFIMYIENRRCFYQSSTLSKAMKAIFKVLIDIRKQKNLIRTNSFEI